MEHELLLRRLFGGCLIAVVAANPALAQSVNAAQGPGVAAARQGGAPRTQQGIIRGTALDKRGRPLPRADLRLRNVESRKVEQKTIANDVGQFDFPVMTNVRYVVEAVDNSGKVIATSNVMVVHAGEVVETVVLTTLPVAPGFAGALSALGETAASFVSAIAATGAPLEPTEPPASPER
jgi:hypothetical protein